MELGTIYFSNGVRLIHILKCSVVGGGFDSNKTISRVKALYIMYFGKRFLNAPIGK